MFSTGSPLAPESFDYVYQAIKDDICARVDLRRHRHRELLRAAATRRCRCGAARSSAAASAWPSTCSTTTGSRCRRARRARRARLHEAVPVDADRLLERPRRRASTARRTSSASRASGATATTPRSPRTAASIIHGRSDATLNPGGVRIGTAEIYRQVEQLAEVVESLVIGQDWPPGEVGDVRVVLFVKLRDGIDARRRADRPHPEAHPREHDAAPRAGEGRAGRPTSRAPRATRSSSSRCATSCTGARSKNLEALANPEALEQFRDREELKT